MKLFNGIPILLLMIGFPVHAEVFKCKQASGKIIYQPSPCTSGTSVQKVVSVKEMTPEQREEAKIKLKTWQDQQAVEEAAKLQAEKERQEELRKQESLELQRRSVAAQEQEAIAAQQRQNQNSGVGLYDPYYRRLNRFPYQPRDPNYMPRPHPHDPMLPPPNKDSPPLPPPQPIVPGPITMPRNKNKNDSSFR
jgi:hypothetical protein